MIALGGWLFALVQFLLNYREKRKTSENQLLESTLGYFERGTQARSIAISLVDSLWVKEKKRIDVIVPVLSSQLYFLLNEAEPFGQEERNSIRLLRVLEKSVSELEHPDEEKAEILNTLLIAKNNPKGVNLTPQILRIWYKKFSGGDTELFDAEE